MILPTMTLIELVKEIQSDYKEVLARWTKFEPKFNKIRVKQMSYPWIWSTKIMTKRHNEWCISFYAQSKKDADIVIPHIYIYFRYEGAIWGAYPIKGTDVLLIFTSHFFERYTERFLEITKDEKYPSIEIMEYFFLRNNHIGCIKPELEDSVRGFCEDGMILGEWISDSAALIKTFLSRNELKVNQYTEYYEAFHNWIVHDMFLAHKGYSLSSMEDFDNLPDSYFTPKEWEKFLKLRGNAMWMNIAIECSKFRIEHEEEYQKCSNMLQTIMDNRSLE
jgi:hypothetical protein